MEKSTHWNQEDGITPIGWVAMLVCIALLSTSIFGGMVLPPWW